MEARLRSTAVVAVIPGAAARTRQARELPIRSTGCNTRPALPRGPPAFGRNPRLVLSVVVAHREYQPMKFIPVFAIFIAGLVSACTYRHETVERPATPAATVVATPVPARNTVVYTDPAGPASTTTVYTTR